MTGLHKIIKSLQTIETKLSVSTDLYFAVDRECDRVEAIVFTVTHVLRLLEHQPQPDVPPWYLQYVNNLKTLLSLSSTPSVIYNIEKISLLKFK